VKKVIFAVLMVACFVSVAVAADSNSVARPGVIAGSPMPGHQFVHARAILAPGTKIITSDPVDGNVNIYDTTGKQLGQITGFSQPQGLATDAKGNLYVVDTNNSRILVYAPPYTKTPKTLSDPGYYPAGVAVFTKGKTTYVGVTNICSAPSCTQGGFIVYKNGKSKGAFQSSSIYRVYFTDFDAKGNLYADGTNSSGAVTVGEIPNAINNKQTFNVLTTGNSIVFPGGVQVTSKGKIAIDDQSGFAVYTYNPPKKGSLVNPIATTSLSGTSDPVEFALTKDNKDLWTGDYGNSLADEFAYPAGGSAVTSWASTYALGIAVVPPDKP